MSDKAIIIGGVAGVVTIGGIAAYFLTRPPTPIVVGTGQVMTVTLTASKTSITAGDSVSFTATAFGTISGSAGQVPLQRIPDASLTLFDKSTSSSSTMGSTNSQGQATISLLFKDTGTFVMYAESASGIKSNNVTITVSPTHSTLPPPPKQYTCYVGKCQRSTVLVNGKYIYTCVPQSFTSDSPCPDNATGGYSTSTAACQAANCASSGYFL